jgi:hypothetical protein
VSLLEQSRERNRRRRRRREGVAKVLLVVILLVLAFFLGIAVARALDDAPDPGGVTTSVRTLTPLPQQPPARTVTVTVTQP